MYPMYSDKVEKIYRTIHNASVDFYKLWLDSMFLKWQWWLNLAITVTPWVLWIIVRKRESTHRLLYAGVISALISTFFDYLGSAMGLWIYISNLIPSVPPYIPWDFCLIPVGVMLTMQIKPKANMFIKGVILAATGAFIWEPLIILGGIYKPLTWKLYYSFPFAFLIYVVSHIAATRKQFEKIS